MTKSLDLPEAKTIFSVEEVLHYLTEASEPFREGASMQQRLKRAVVAEKQKKLLHEAIGNGLVRVLSASDGMPYTDGYIPYGAQIDRSALSLDEAIKYASTLDISVTILKRPAKKSITGKPVEIAYRARIKEKENDGTIPSREEDREWAKKNGFSIVKVEELRRSLSPSEWRQTGRRSKEVAKN